MRLILLGPPGAGKGTQAEFIAHHFHIPFISTGEMLRRAVRSGSPLGEKVKSILEAGQLVPDAVMIDLVKSRIAEADCKNGFLLDGFPRTIPQAEALRQANIQLDYVLEIRVDDELIIHRLSGRRVHASSGRTYHIHFQPPKEIDKDDITGELLIQRDDDKEETIKKRLSVYHAQTEPLVHYYQTWVKDAPKEAPRYISVDGGHSVEKVKESILKALKIHQ